jgi:hypothetical protein
MATWALTAQYVTGAATATVGATDRIWWNGAAFGTNVVVGAYQDTTHLSNSSDAHTASCTTNSHIMNTKYLTGTTVSINGGGSVTLAANTVPTTAQCGLKWNFQDGASVTTSNGIFYAYDGATDATPMAGVTFQAGEGGVGGTTTWVAANGSGSALALQDNTTSTTHDFFLFTSVSPTSTGAKTGKIKISITYV